MSSDSWADNNDLPDADYSNLDLSFDDILEFENTVQATASAVQPSFEDQFNQDENDKDSTCCGKKEQAEETTAEYEEEDYIVGTLIVRVVAARDLIPVKDTSGGGLGKLFRGSSSSRRNGGVNPYASVRFGKTSQRTSQLFNTTHPTWPRGENMFMDVTHPPMIPRSSAKQTTTKTKQAAANAKDPRPAHPGDPPLKHTGSTRAAKNPEPIHSSSRTVRADETEAEGIPKPERPILTVAIFHAGNNQQKGKQLYNPSKSSYSGDSDDVFLGMAGVDLTTLLTGKERSLDAWLPLQGGRATSNETSNSHDEKSGCGTVRIVCEYESSDVAPRPGDRVRFTGYCHFDDIYPLRHTQLYKVMRDDDDGSATVENEDYVTISYNTPEGWVCSAVAHRYMLVCEERHVGALEVCHDEFVSLGQRLSRSLLVHTVQHSLQKIPDEGLVGLGVAIFQGGGSLFSRWMREGIQTAIQDIVYTTNLDGHNDPSAEESLAEDSPEEFFEASEHDDDSAASTSLFVPSSSQQLPTAAAASSSWEPLPNMPSCPITGEAMRDPVVAADGHTYERVAISRWLQTSDKSPLTGSVFTHKNLVPNYMLVSSLQETATNKTTATTQSSSTTTTTNVAVSDATNTKLEPKFGSSGDLEEQALN